MSDTPETDAILKQFEHHLPNWLASEIMADVARRLERERDILKKHTSIMDISHRTANDEYFKLAVENENLERERDEAVRSCQIWQDGHSEIVEERDLWKENSQSNRDEYYRLAAERDKLEVERDLWKAEAERWRALSREHDEEVVIDDYTAPYGEWWEVTKP